MIGLKESSFLSRVTTPSLPPRWVRDIIFLLVFFYQCFSYGYFDQLERGPYGVHAWRKADGASMALNYYQFNQPFFEPIMHNHFNASNGGVGELPLFYYVVGKLYHITGTSEAVFQLTWLFLLLFGFYFLFQWALMIIPNLGLALGVAFFSFTPPIIAIYGIYYLPDTIALALAFPGLYFISKFYRSKKMLDQILAIVFFSLAILTKATSVGLMLAALASFLVIDVLVEKGSFWRWAKTYIGFIVPLLFLLLWVFYARYYNDTNQNGYFFLGTNSIWDLPAERIEEIVELFYQNWMRNIGSGFIFIFPLLAVLLLFIPAYRKYRIWMWATLMYLLFVIAETMLFFGKFDQHDYYTVVWYGFLPLALVAVIKPLYTSLSNSLLKISFTILILFAANQSFIHTHDCIDYRMGQDEWVNFLPNEISEMRPVLESLGIKPEDKVLSIFDPSPNLSLYYLNVQGFTNLGRDEVTKDFVELNIQRGAKYLIVHSEKYHENPVLKEFMVNELHRHGPIRVYSLKNDAETLL